MNRSRWGVYVVGVGAAVAAIATSATAKADIEISYDGHDIINTFPLDPYTGLPETPAMSGPYNDLAEYVGPDNMGLAMHSTDNAPGDINDVTIADGQGFANIGSIFYPNSGATDSIATATNGGGAFIGSFDGTSPVDITGDKAFATNGGAIVLDSSNSGAVAVNTGTNGAYITDATHSIATAGSNCSALVVCSGSEADIIGQPNSVITDSTSLDTNSTTNTVTASDVTTLNGAAIPTGAAHGIENPLLSEAIAGIPATINLGRGDIVPIMPLIEPLQSVHVGDPVAAATSTVVTSTDTFLSHSPVAEAATDLFAIFGLTPAEAAAMIP
jgi:hypothetical protein